VAVHTAFQYAGLPPAAYPMAIQTIPISRNRLSTMKRRQGLPGGKARAALRARAESPLNVNPIQPLPGTSVISVPPTIAAGQIHKIEPVQLKFTTGQRWMGVALLALVAFSLFRK